MFKLLLALPPVLLFALLPQQPAATPAQGMPAVATPDQGMPADAATRTNPVKPTSESQAHAKQVYSFDCAVCHGPNGNGKGELVADMNLKMRDFTDPGTLKGTTDGELFYAIKNGDEKDKMPPEAPRAKSDDDIWNLVILVRSFAKK
jgi:mono/diheme cytochrome c family protein